ncbi:MAG: phosphoglycerate kinase, partial [Patescibacteria group bacterium]
MMVKSIQSIKDFKNKSILVRCDFDVPIVKIQNTNNKIQKYKISDDTRLKANLETIKYLLNKRVKQIILIGHLGRPNGKVVQDLSLLPIKKYLEKILPKAPRYKIQFPNKFQIPNSNYRILMLENIRFFKEEESNNKKFAKKLSKLADIYVNECFSTSHRFHASLDAIQNYLPSYAGLNLEKEIKNLYLDKIKKPLVLIIGGAKIETKLPVINNFINKADNILLGGAVANNFLKALGFEVGKSLVDKKYLKQAQKIIKLKNNKLLLPIDTITQDNKIKLLNKIKSTDRILDIGPKTQLLFNGIIKSAKIIIWNGPMGYFEDKNFKNGTEKIAENIFNNKKAKIIIGGGETIEVIKKYSNKVINGDIFISTGGGAMLEFLAGNSLPGLKRI